MRPVEPFYDKGYPITIAKDQPQYEALPARIEPDQEMQITTEWQIDGDELAALMVGGRVRLTVLTFGHPLQPIKLEVLWPPRDSVPELVGTT